MEQAVALSRIDRPEDLVKGSSAVIKLLFEVLQSLESWHDEFCQNMTTPPYWLVPSCAVSPASPSSSAEKVFPSCFKFQSLDVAVPVAMYWAVAAQLYSCIVQICGLVKLRLGHEMDLELVPLAAPTITVPTSPPEASNHSVSSVDKHDQHAPLDIQEEGAKMARFCCQSMEYFHQVEMGTYGGHATTYPCWSARQYFRLHPGYESELSWVMSMHRLEGPGMRWGLSMMTFADIPTALGAS